MSESGKEIFVLKKFLSWGNLLLLCGLVLAFFLFQDYGASWDEPEYYEYAGNTLRAYSIKDRVTGEFNLAANLGPADLRYYGPSYLIFWGLPVRTILRLFFPNVVEIDLWHLVNYLFYVLGGWIFFKLVSQWVSNKAGLAATLLFWTQPILFGSAWINPKDIPFLVLFIGSVYFGIKATERLDRIGEIAFPPIPQHSNDNPTPGKWVLVVFAVLSLALLGSFIFTDSIELFIEQQIINIYHLEPQTLLRKVFDRAAPTATLDTLNLFSTKAITLFKRYRVLAVVLSALLFVWAYVTRRFPGFWKASFAGLKTYWKELFQNRPWQTAGVLALAVLFLGSAVSARIIGPLAGVLVVMYAFLRFRWKSVPLLLVYGIASFAVMVISWPYLWENTMENLLFVLSRNTEFPTIYNIFFNGVVYKSNNLPVSYLPTLLSITLTEISLPLFIFGLTLWGLDLRKKKGHFLLGVLFLLWFLIPLLYVLIFQPPLYDSYRHFFFILPAIFLIGSYGLEFLLNKIKRVRWQVVLITVLLLPSMVSIIRLHPYEYAYYNSFVGGDEKRDAKV